MKKTLEILVPTIAATMLTLGLQAQTLQAQTVRPITPVMHPPQFTTPNPAFLANNNLQLATGTPNFLPNTGPRFATVNPAFTTGNITFAPPAPIVTPANQPIPPNQNFFVIRAPSLVLQNPQFTTPNPAFNVPNPNFTAPNPRFLPTP